MRVLTLAEKNRVVSDARIRNSDSSTTISPLTHVAHGTPALQLRNPGGCNHSDLDKTVDDMDAAYISMSRISESLRAIVQSTQYAITTADRSLQQKIAQVYQDLSKAGIQLQQLKSSTARFKASRKRTTAAASDSDTTSSKFEHLGSGRYSLDKSQSAIIEVFFDCVSRFSSEDSVPSMDEPQKNFFESPEYRFELLPSFYPEQYVSEGSISQEVIPVAIWPSMDSPRTLRYFLNYAETARRWQRIVVVAAFHGERQQTDSFQVASYSDNLWGTAHVLPSTFHTLLRTLLPFIEFFSSVTQISLDMNVGESGQIMADSPRVEVIEDESETSKSDERDFLQYIDSVCCKKYVESDVITYSRINSTQYRVYVDSQAYCESKVAFASGRKQSKNALLDYLNEIKHMISLRGCANVSGCMGVVLDDTRSHLRGYLKELPMLACVESLLALAKSRSMTIPQSIRELWARQLIQAIVEIHSQTLIAGVFHLSSVGVKADGTAVLHRVQRSEKYVADRSGLAPPELRTRYRKDDSGSAVRGNLNFQTDIFQLGMVLWQLMEHVPNLVGHFCAKSGCPHLPRTTCMATHANPVELPECGNHVPTYLCDIIRDCRLPDPSSRVSTSDLADVLCSTPQPDNTSAEIKQALMPYISLSIDFDGTAYCDVCADVTTGIYFFCGICGSGDFMICPACFEKGHRCLVLGHRLVKRARGKFDYIEIPE